MRFPNQEINTDITPDKSLTPSVSGGAPWSRRKLAGNQMPESLLFSSSRRYRMHDRYWIEISLQRRELSQFVRSETI